MKKKGLAAFLIIAMVFSSASFAFAAGEVHFERTEHGDKTFPQITYQRPDMEAFNKLAEEIKVLCQNEANSDKVLSSYEELMDKYEIISTMQSLAQVHSYLDSKSKHYSDEFVFMTDAYMTADSVMSDVAQTILASPCKEAAGAKWGNAYCEEVLTMEAASPEDIALSKEASRLINLYNEKSIDTYYASIDGKDISYEELYEQYILEKITWEEFLQRTLEIAKKKNEVLGPIYLRTVKINNEIARSAGYDNYIEYAYHLYGREYSPQDTEELHRAVKENLVPVACKIQDIKDLDAIDEYAARELTTEKTMELIFRQLGKIGPELKESYDFMKKYELYDLDYEENKINMAFTVSFPSEKAVYMFRQPYGFFSDFTTIVHELGHYNQSYWVPAKQKWPEIIQMDLAEVHSQGLELLFLDYYDEMFGEYAEEGVASVLHQMVASAMVNGCYYDEIEQYAYTHPNLTLEGLNQKIKELAGEYGLEPESVMYDWVSIPHLYQMPGYYISYAVSAITSSELWEESLDDRQAAIEDYFTVVAMANEPYYEALKAAGLSEPFDEQLISRIRSAYERELKIMVDTYGHWSEESVDTLTYYGVLDGIEGTDGYYYFKPEKSMTRAEFTKMLYAIVDGKDGGADLLESQEFTDVKAGSWSAPYVEWAVKNGIAGGTGNGKFSPQAEITRQDMAVMMVKLAKKYGYEIAEDETSDTTVAFSDDKAISSYASEAVHTLKERGILSGMPDGSFAPKKEMTRAEACSALEKLIYE